MTAELVGPLPTITFADGSYMPYDVPRNTLDNRYVACTDHHPACDCREALLAEDRGEWRAEDRATQRAFDEVLAGHLTVAFDRHGNRDRFAECKCTGCEIARRTHYRPAYAVSAEHREALRSGRSTNCEVPF